MRNWLNPILDTKLIKNFKAHPIEIQCHALFYLSPCLGNAANIYSINWNAQLCFRGSDHRNSTSGFGLYCLVIDWIIFMNKCSDWSICSVTYQSFRKLCKTDRPTDGLIVIKSYTPNNSLNHRNLHKSAFIYRVFIKYCVFRKF